MRYLMTLALMMAFGVTAYAVEADKIVPIYNIPLELECSFHGKKKGTHCKVEADVCATIDKDGKREISACGKEALRENHKDRNELEIQCSNGFDGEGDAEAVIFEKDDEFNLFVESRVDHKDIELLVKDLEEGEEDFDAWLKIEDHKKMWGECRVEIEHGVMTPRAE